MNLINFFPKPSYNLATIIIFLFQIFFTGCKKHNGTPVAPPGDNLVQEIIVVDSNGTKFTIQIPSNSIPQGTNVKARVMNHSEIDPALTRGLESVSSFIEIMSTHQPTGSITITITIAPKVYQSLVNANKVPFVFHIKDEFIDNRRAVEILESEHSQNVIKVSLSNFSIIGLGSSVCVSLALNCAKEVKYNLSYPLVVGSNLVNIYSKKTAFCENSTTYYVDVLIDGKIVATSNNFAIGENIKIRFTASRPARGVIRLYTTCIPLLVNYVFILAEKSFVIDLPAFAEASSLLEQYKPVFRFASGETHFPIPVENAFPDGDRSEYLSTRDASGFNSSISGASGPATIYSTAIKCPNHSDVVALSYWSFYALDTKPILGHEGDWEMVTVFLFNSLPIGVVFAQHDGYEYKSWNEVERFQGGKRPIVYVAKGSHASYHKAGKFLFVDDANGKGQELSQYSLVKMPRLSEITSSSIYNWLLYTGDVGKRGYSIKSPPKMPPYNGSPNRWLDPCKWANIPITQSLPIVSTTPITGVTSTSAIGGGNVISQGSSIVTARGVCWDTLKNPTIANHKTIDGSGTGIFISNITRLTPSTTYYVRAYATNNTGTGYGNQVSFTTSASPNLTGTWQGTLTQPGGPFHQLFNFKMVLSQTGFSVNGISRIEVPNTSYFGEMELSGSVQGDSFSFKEKRIISQNLPQGIAWCIKQGTLTYYSTTDSLIGPWSAFGCAPGYIRLHKK